MISKIQGWWIVEDDRNTYFYHTSAVIKGAKKQVQKLNRSSREWCDDKKELMSMTFNFFRSLYMDDLYSMCMPVLDHGFLALGEDTMRLLSKAFSANEVKQALFFMDQNKASGSNGFHAVFFQQL